MHKLDHKGIGAVAFILILLAVGVISLAGWKFWDSKSDNADSDQNSMQSASDPKNNAMQDTKPEKVGTGTIITTGDSEFGPMLFDNKKQAIYIWELEESSKPECYGDCAKAWPPVLTEGAPRGTGDVNSELLGTTKRTDGSTQVTYNGHPLYYYAHEAPGEVECHNISTHGGLWWVIRPNGIRAD